MVLRPITKAFSLALGLAAIGLCSISGVFAEGTELLALNAPVRAASDPAVQQAVQLLSKNEKIKAGQTKRGTIFNSHPANDTTVVKYRKDLDRVLILGGSEVIPM